MNAQEVVLPDQIKLKDGTVVSITALPESEKRTIPARDGKDDGRVELGWMIKPKRLALEAVPELASKLKRKVPKLENYEIYYLGSGAEQVPSLLGIRPKQDDKLE